MHYKCYLFDSFRPFRVALDSEGRACDAEAPDGESKQLVRDVSCLNKLNFSPWVDEIDQPTFKRLCQEFYATAPARKAMGESLPTPDPNKLEVMLKGILTDHSSAVRVLDDGRVELEHCDFSAGAEVIFGGDVSWFYRIAVSEKPRLFELLEKKAGAPVTDDRTMLDAFALCFKDAQDVQEWLAEQGIPYEEERSDPWK